MSALDYYTMLLGEVRKSHSYHIREAARWRYCLREACLEDARADRRAAHRYIMHIRKARNNV